MRFVCASLLALVACGEDATPRFPADYAATFVEVRDCRSSGDHDLRMIRVVADPEAAMRYRLRDGDFAPGALVVKEEFDFGEDCSGPPLQWTVMERDPDAEAIRLGWRWQRVDGDRSVVTEDEPRCYGCHADCGVAPDGYLGTCAVP